MASAGTGGVGLGCMKLWDSLMIVEFVIIKFKSVVSLIGHISLKMKLIEKA